MSSTLFYSHDKLTPKEKRDSLYSPFVIRPREVASVKYGGNCRNVLFPLATPPHGKGIMSTPNAKVEASYYAQRPLLNPDTYYKMLDNLFRYIKKNYTKNPPNVDKSLFIYSNSFCQRNCFTESMKFVMGIINSAKKQEPSMKAYANVDNWGGEQFAYLEEKVFMFFDLFLIDFYEIKFDDLFIDQVLINRKLKKLSFIILARIFKART